MTRDEPVEPARHPPRPSPQSPHYRRRDDEPDDEGVEHPGRFVLIDTDGSEPSNTPLPAAIEQTTEPQLALREGRVLACDASDPKAVEGLLDDGTIDSLDAAKLEHVFAPKADGAWNLHQATAGLELSGFVVFSSVAGTLGSPRPQIACPVRHPATDPLGVGPGTTGSVGARRRASSPVASPIRLISRDRR